MRVCYEQFGFLSSFSGHSFACKLINFHLGALIDIHCGFVPGFGSTSSAGTRFSAFVLH